MCITVELGQLWVQAEMEAGWRLFILVSRAAAIYRDIFYISRYAIYRDIFWSYRDTNVHGYSEIDGERRKYTNSHSADATSVGPHHAHTFELYCKLSAPIEIQPPV